MQINFLTLLGLSYILGRWLGMVVHGSWSVHPVVVCSNRSNYKLYAISAYTTCSMSRVII